MTAKPENLMKNYPADFLAGWDGCVDKDCLPGCWVTLEGGHCARLQEAFADYQLGVERADNGRNTGGKAYR